MTSDEERLKRRSRRTRNHLAKSLESRVFRQRRVDKNYKLKRLQEIEEVERALEREGAKRLDFYSD